MKADLHIHTNFSDGTLSPKELLDYAKLKKLDIIAITDHDCIEAIPEAFKYGKKLGIRVIAGIEISTYKNNESIHLLGYFPHQITPEIYEFMESQRQSRNQRMIEYAHKVSEEYDIEINYERLMGRSKMLSRSHLCDEIMISLPHLSRGHIFKTFLSSSNAKVYIPSTKLSTEEGIAVLKRANAFISLAHPTLLEVNSIESIIALGINGIEAIYPLNKNDDEAVFRMFARKNNLIITGGSDFHFIGDKSHGDLGEYALTGEDLELFLEKLDGKKLKITESEFITSGTTKDHLPKDNKTEFVFCGRSNVGKSSFINSLTNRKKLAYASASPGKTQTLNFYLINQKFYFVDVPGYGYAKVNKVKKETFGVMIEEYLGSRPNLSLVFMLVDFRHSPTEDDILMYEYLKYLNRRVCVVATKKDKVKKSMYDKNRKEIINKLKIDAKDYFIITSAETKEGLEECLKIIDDNINMSQ